MGTILDLEKRQDRDEEFVKRYVELCGNATAAARAVGVSDVSASTVGYRMKNRLTKEIDKAQREALKGYAPKAITQIQNLAENAVNENVRLSANRDLLDRAGYKPIERSEVTEVTDISNMSTEEIQAELDALYASAGKKLVNA